MSRQAMKISQTGLQYIVFREISRQNTLNEAKELFIIRKLEFKKGISKNALERATGISRGTIIRIIKN